MKMALRREKQVRHTTAAREKPLKTSVQVAGSKIGKKLSELFDGVEATLPNDADGIEIQQVSCDSRSVEKGALFFALHGAKADGNTFIQDALKRGDRKSTRLNSSHTVISYAVFCLKKKKT